MNFFIKNYNLVLLIKIKTLYLIRGINFQGVIMICLKSIDANRIVHSKSITVENPKDCDNFSWLLDQEVEINDHIYYVTKVICKEKIHYKQGERISIVVW